MPPLSGTVSCGHESKRKITWAQKINQISFNIKLLWMYRQWQRRQKGLIWGGNYGIWTFLGSRLEPITL